jgi:Pentapeptide repeats (8 copies)
MKGMANQEYLAKLEEGVEAWNQWREKDPFSQPDLQGADLREAQLQKAYLGGAQLQGAHLYSAQLQGAHLNEAFFDNATGLNEVILGDNKYGVASLANISWGGVNLAVVDWSPLKMLGDEYQAHQPTDSKGMKKDKAIRPEQYRAAVRANRQLAVVLRDQGLNEEADHFAYRAQLCQRVVFRRQGLLPKAKPLKRVQKLSAYVLSLFLDVLAGYGYHPAKTLFWYVFVICSFTLAYSLSGHLPLFPDAFVFSLMSFHGRGFFPSLSGETNLHNPVVVRAAFEAVVGLFIEISFIATFTQRFFGR